MDRDTSRSDNDKRKKKTPRGNTAGQGRWQVDVVPLPAYLTPPDAPGEACVVLVVEAERGLVRMVELDVLDALPSPLLNAVTMAATEPAPPGEPGWPEVVEVRDAQVATWLAALDAPFRIEAHDELPTLRAALDALFERMAPREPVVYDDSIEPALLRLAARLAELAPWRRYREHDVLELSSDVAPLPFPILSFLGTSGQLIGTALYRDLESRRRVLRAFARHERIDPFDSQVLWYFDAGELSPRDRAAFASSGYPRLDLYPGFQTIDAGQARPPSHVERGSMQRALESAVAFVEAHREPPAEGTALDVVLQRRVRERITVTQLHVEDAELYGEPQLLESLIVGEVMLFGLELPRPIVRALNTQPGSRLRVDVAALEALPEQVPVFVLRGRKSVMLHAVERLDALGIDALEPLTAEPCAACEHDAHHDHDAHDMHHDHDDTMLAALVDGEPVARLTDGDEDLVGALDAMAAVLDGHVLVVFSAGGALKMRPDKVRSRDVVGLALLRWHGGAVL